MATRLPPGKVVDSRCYNDGSHHQLCAHCLRRRIPPREASPDHVRESYEGLTFARGPEIESWFGVRDRIDPAAENEWSFLPFMALSDGAHAYDAYLAASHTDTEHELDLLKISPISLSAKKLQVPDLLLPSLAYHVLVKWTPVSF